MKNIFLEPNTLFRVVGFDEPLQVGFLIRERYESPIYSDSGGWDTTFKGDDWMGTAWHPIEDEFPGWVGQEKTYTYNDYLKILFEPENKKYCKPLHEIIEIVQQNT